LARHFHQEEHEGHSAAEPQPNPNLEIRNPKQFRKSKCCKFKTGSGRSAGSWLLLAAFPPF
jgi:hypothetical protein